MPSKGTPLLGSLKLRLLLDHIGVCDRSCEVGLGIGFRVLGF